MLKNFKFFLNLFQLDGPINEIFFSPELLFLKSISEAICDLVLFVSRKGMENYFSKNCEVSFQYLKTLLSTRFSVLSFVGSNLISLNSLSPLVCQELIFEQKQIYLFCVTCIFFLIFWLIKEYKEIQA